MIRRRTVILLGAVTAFKPSPLDRGYGVRQAVAHLRSHSRVPVVTGLRFGDVEPPREIRGGMPERCREDRRLVFEATLLGDDHHIERFRFSRRHQRCFRGFMAGVYGRACQP